MLGCTYTWAPNSRPRLLLCQMEQKESIPMTCQINSCMVIAIFTMMLLIPGLRFFIYNVFYCTNSISSCIQCSLPFLHWIGGKCFGSMVIQSGVHLSPWQSLSVRGMGQWLPHGQATRTRGDPALAVPLPTQLIPRGLLMRSINSKWWVRARKHPGTPDRSKRRWGQGQGWRLALLWCCWDRDWGPRETAMLSWDVSRVAGGMPQVGLIRDIKAYWCPQGPVSFRSYFPNVFIRLSCEKL